MSRSESDPLDREMMARAIALARDSSAAGKYPYGAVICRSGTTIAESANRVKRDGDVTRHAEVIAINGGPKGARHNRPRQLRWCEELTVFLLQVAYLPMLDGVRIRTKWSGV